MFCHRLLILFCCCFLAFFSWCETVQAARNAEEEAICAPFLTSKATSPLIGGLKRNLKVDEDGEFSCELVLQDENLPMQIRLTIHEGLSWLAIRHVSMGLQRQRAVVRHLRLMTALSPKTFDFSYRAGLWGLDPEVAEPEKAIEDFQRALYGAASDESDPKRTPYNVYLARKGYVRALGLIGDTDKMYRELGLILQEHPFDFDAVFLKSMIDETAKKKVQPGATTVEGANDFSNEDKILSSFRSAIRALFVDAYHGFTPPVSPVSESGTNQQQQCDASQQQWQPQIFSKLLDAETFNGFVQRREPFILSFGSLEKMTEALEWDNVPQWLLNNKEYMVEKVGEDEVVMVESSRTGRRALSDIDNDEVDDEDTVQMYEHQRAGEEDCFSVDCDGNFGLGFSSHRKFTKFTSLIQTHFVDPNEGTQQYLNIQRPGSGEGKYRPPLHKLADDIPPPLGMIYGVWANVTDVNMWMGEVAAAKTTKSRMHMDATDNLYLVLEGQKQFSLLSPAQAYLIDTVSPSFAIFSTGLSFQFNINHFRDFLREKYHNASRDAANGLESNVPSPQGNLLLESLLDKDSASIVYDTSNFHFATSHLVEQRGTSCGLAQSLAHISLTPGDVLYLPTGWFHQVESSGGAHTSINYWWKALDWEGALAFERATSRKVYEELLQQITT